MTLRPYQDAAVVAIRNAFAALFRAVLLTLPTGGGKTVIFSYIAATSAARGRKVLILVHRIELLRQTAAKLREAGVRVGLVNPGYSADPGAPVQVASVQTMVKRLQLFRHFDLIITDECFVPGTSIDGTAIETLQPGDIVNAFNEQTFAIERRRVVRVFKKQHSGPLYKVSVGNREIICTGNHPIFTAGGWLNADQITVGTTVFIYGMSNMRGTDHWPACNLFGGMPSGDKIADNERNQPGTRFAQDERAQPYGQRIGPAENVSHVAADWPCPEGARRQRLRFDHPAKNAAGRTGAFWMGWKTRICIAYKAAARFWLSTSLQNRYSIARTSFSNRSGWGQPLRTYSASPGPQENGFPNLASVDRVAVYEQGTEQWVAAMRGQSFVYNFEVEGLNTYVANGIVVHNCHHIISNTYRTIIAAYPEAYQLGVTATPIRGDGKGLGVEAGGVFNTMVIGPTVAELIAGGFLVRPALYAPRERLDFSDVKTRLGDYDKAEIGRRVDKPRITGDAVRHYTELCPGMPAVAFCISVEHARHVALEFQQAGYRAACVDGTMDDADRSRILGGLATGATQVVTSVDVISEGTDIPAIYCAILLRPTQSLGLYLQQVGRALRPMPGKDKAIILDHVGNCLIHGLPEEDREWSLDGEFKVKKSKKKPDEPVVRVYQCRECYAVFSATIMVCPECGEVRIVEGRSVRQEEGELVELTALQKLQIQKNNRIEVARASSIQELEAIAAARGYKKGWAQHLYNSRTKTGTTG